MNVIDLIRTSFENASKNPTPKTVDVAKVTADELAALPADMRTAVKDAQGYAQKNFSKMSPPPTITVTAAPANGGSPVTVIVPPGRRDELNVHTHYHGDRAQAVSGENKAAESIAERIRKGDKTVWVLPEAVGPGASTDWSNPIDVDKTTNEALRGAGLVPKDVDQRVVSAHSSGGRALTKTLERGGSISGDELIIQDALYTGVFEDLKEKLRGATLGLSHVTIVPAEGTSGAVANARELAKVLNDDWGPGPSNADVAKPAPSHYDASAVFEGTRTQPKPTGDRFERGGRW